MLRYDLLKALQKDTAFAKESYHVIYSFIKQHPEINNHKMLSAGRKPTSVSVSVWLRRQKLLEILDAQKLKLTVSDLTRELQRYSKYADVKYPIVKNDIEKDGSIQNHSKLDFSKGPSREFLDARIEKLLEILNAQTSKISRRELLEKMQEDVRFRDMNDTNLSWDIRRSEDIRNNPMLASLITRLDQLKIRNRRDKLFEILESLDEEINRVALLEKLHAIPEFSKIGLTTLRRDVASEERLKTHHMLILLKKKPDQKDPNALDQLMSVEEDKKSFAKQRRDKIVSILDVQKETIDRNQLLALLVLDPRFSNVRSLAVRNDAHLDPRIKEHKKFSPKTFSLASISVQARREKILEILDNQKSKISLQDLFNELRKDPLYRDTSSSVLSHDIAKEPKIKNHVNYGLRVDRAHEIKARERREKIFEILEMQDIPISQKDILAEMHKDPRFLEVIPENIRDDIFRVPRIKTHKMLMHQKWSYVNKKVKARRQEIVDVLSQQVEAVSTSDLLEIIKQDPAFNNIKMTELLGDRKNDPRIKGHPKLLIKPGRTKGILSQKVLRRRIKLINILNLSHKPIRPEVLLERYNKRYPDSPIKLGVILYDIYQSEEIRGHLMLDYVKTIGTQGKPRGLLTQKVLMRRAVLLAILNAGHQPMRPEILLERYNKYYPDAQVKLPTILYDINNNSQIGNHKNFDYLKFP